MIVIAGALFSIYLDGTPAEQADQLRRFIARHIADDAGRCAVCRQPSPCPPRQAAEDTLAQYEAAGL